MFKQAAMLAVAAAAFTGCSPTNADLIEPAKTRSIDPPPLSMDIAREVWWTTTVCPEGVRTPCLDPHVSIHDVPEWAGGDAANP